MTADTVCVQDSYMKPTSEYPWGSWLHTIDGEVTVATGYYAQEYPNKPSPYWHKGPPFVMVEWVDLPWEKKGEDNG